MYSAPIRRAGSPLQDSSGPSVANLTPAICMSFAKSYTTFLLRSSYAPAQPTQNRTSASGASEI
jgi:hypothetical protein